MPTARPNLNMKGYTDEGRCVYRRDHIKQLNEARRQQLNNSLLYARFNRDGAEVSDACWDTSHGSRDLTLPCYLIVSLGITVPRQRECESASPNTSTCDGQWVFRNFLMSRMLLDSLLC